MISRTEQTSPRPRNGCRSSTSLEITLPTGSSAPFSMKKATVHSSHSLFITHACRQVYVHHTTATDTSNIQMVFDACKDIWISEAIETFNF